MYFNNFNKITLPEQKQKNKQTISQFLDVFLNFLPLVQMSSNDMQKQQRKD